MFYVTVINGKRTGFLLGPYDSHQDALDNVERGRELAIDADPFACFYYVGTCRWKDPTNPPKSVFGD